MSTPPTPDVAFGPSHFKAPADSGFERLVSSPVLRSGADPDRFWVAHVGFTPGTDKLHVWVQHGLSGKPGAARHSYTISAQPVATWHHAIRVIAKKLKEGFTMAGPATPTHFGTSQGRLVSASWTLLDVLAQQRMEEIDQARSARPNLASLSELVSAAGRQQVSPASLVLGDD